ncbi:MAG: hypothetical protein KDD62_05405 [Bdellovibrionales bacterium]|nr:hypothetical protein [Bdellovibrionales bacterium]
MVDTEFLALRRLMNTMVFLCLICGAAIYAMGFSKQQVGREFLAPERGIGLANPAPDKDGTWVMPIELELAQSLSKQQFFRWEVNVVGHDINLKLFVVNSSVVQRLLKLNRNDYGASFKQDALQEGVYQVHFEDPRGGSPRFLGEVEVSTSNDFGGKRIWY